MAEDRLGSRPDRAKRHHVVPRFYLARWADEKGRIRVIEPAQNRDFLTTTTNVAVHTEFYTIDTEEGPSDEVETLISKIEGLAAPIIERIDAGQWPLDADDRGVMANFLSVQLARQPGLRGGLETGLETMIKMSAQMQATIPEFLKRAAADVFGTNATPDQVAEVKEALLEDFRVKMPRNWWMESFLDGAAHFVQPIYDMAWTLIDSVEAEFLTSDQPMAHWRLPDDESGRPVGLLNAQYTTLPLSPRLLLRLGFTFTEQGRLLAQPGDKAMGIEPPGTAIINGRTVGNAYRSIFLRPEAE